MSFSTPRDNNNKEGAVFPQNSLACYIYKIFPDSQGHNGVLTRSGFTRSLHRASPESNNIVGIKIDDQADIKEITDAFNSLVNPEKLSYDVNDTRMRATVTSNDSILWTSDAEPVNCALLLQLDDTKSFKPELIFISPRSVFIKNLRYDLTPELDSIITRFISRGIEQKNNSRK